MPQKPVKYFSMSVTAQEADIFIFGDIVDPFWQELDAAWGITSETSGYSLAKDLQKLDPGVTQINVHINSYGGDVAQGLAIHNLLKQHKAKVVTIADGFACSAASVVFEAGDERLVNMASLLMIHPAWGDRRGNAKQLRKAADDLETITQASVNAYMARVNIGEQKLMELLDNETWILPEDAVAWGFATGIVEEQAATGMAAASARQAAMRLMMAGMVLPAPPTATAPIDMQAVADAVVAKLRAELEAEARSIQTDPPPPAAQDRSLFNFLNALTGRKAGT